VPGDQVEVAGDIGAHAVDVGSNLDDDEGVAFLRDKVEAPRTDVASLRDVEACKEHDADDHLGEAILCHNP